MLEDDEKINVIKEFTLQNLGEKYSDMYMKLLMSNLGSEEELKSKLAGWGLEDILRALENDLMQYVTIVKDTRLARKMYPDYEVRPDGKLVIDIISPRY